MNHKEFISEEFLYKALIISLAVHLMFISSSLLVPDHAKKKKLFRKVEVIYAVSKQADSQVPIIPPSPSQPVTPNKLEKITAHDALSASVAIKERKAQPDGLKISERAPDKNRAFNAAMKKSVSVPLLESEKINNPAYSNYYSLVRSRIRQRAYFNYSEYYAGEVYLTFILNNDGTLKDLKIIEEKSTAGVYLRTVGLKSIKDACPFPPFPGSLKYPELTFNVVISFQVHDQ